MHCNKLNQSLILIIYFFLKKEKFYSNIWSNFAISAHITSEVKNGNHSDGTCQIQNQSWTWTETSWIYLVNKQTSKVRHRFPYSSNLK